MRNSSTGEIRTVYPDQVASLGNAWQKFTPPKDAPAQNPNQTYSTLPPPSTATGGAIPLPASYDYETDFNNLINKGWFAGLSRGTVLADQSGKYFYKGSGNQVYEIKDEAAYWNLVKQGQIKSGPPIGFKDPNKQQAPHMPGGTGTTTDVDQTGWTEAMKASYEALKGYIDLLNSQGNMVNPAVEISDAQAAQFLEQAKTELGPYYTQLITQAQEDAKVGYNRVLEDYRAGQDAIQQSYKAAMGATQEGFAETGRTFSTQRTDAERDLAKSATQALEGNERALQRSGQDIGAAAERYLGSKNIQSTPYTPNTVRPVLGIPGLFDFKEQQGSSRSLYTPTGNTTGTLEGSRTTAELLRQKELVGNERTKRAFSTQ